MRRLIDAVHGFAVDEEGAAIVEYAILVALIAIVAILVVAALGNKVSEKFSEFESKWT